MNQKKRIEWIDYARVCAIVCVILCHATENSYRDVIFGERTIGPALWIIENTLFTIGRMGVPLFLAISGTLLLAKEKNVVSFYKKSLLPILLTTEIWFAADYLFVCVIQNQDFNPAQLILEMLFLQEPALSHMWYMPMIIGIYLFLPFLSKVMKQFENGSVFLVPFLVLFVTSVFIPTVNTFLSQGIFSTGSIEIQIDVSFGGGVYGLYLISGYFIGSRKILNRFSTECLAVIFLLAFILNTAGQYFLYSHSYFESDHLIWYTSIGIFVMGLLLFEFIRRGQGRVWKCFHIRASALARCSFGIYLIHKLVLECCITYLPLSMMKDIPEIILIGLISFFVSLAIVSAFCGKLKPVGKILFLIK